MALELPSLAVATRIVDALRSDPGNAELRNYTIKILDELYRVTKQARSYLTCMEYVTADEAVHAAHDLAKATEGDDKYLARFVIDNS